MSASKKIKNLGIIAGGGQLPQVLIKQCKQIGIEPYVVGFKGQTELLSIKEVKLLVTGLARAGEIISFFKKHNVSDLVMIGSIRRPSFSTLKPDLKGMKILSKISMKSLGDNALLEILEQELNNEGFTLHGIQDFCDHITAPVGTIGQYQPSQSALRDIKIGIIESQKIGASDIGQSVIIQDGKVVAIEDEEGTDKLIEKSSALLKQSGEKGVLVKSRKPQQSRNLDLPTIGVQTVENAHRAGLAGIAIHANNTIIVDTKKVAEFADQYKLFLHGFNI